MDTRAFLEQAIEELEETRKELEYWKQKYENLEQTCRELVEWCKNNIKGETMGSEKV